jgi:hypothetical protein
LLWKNVNGYGGLELNKVGHEVESAPVLHHFSKRSLRKKFINPIESETPSISLHHPFEKLDSWDFHRSAESWCQIQYSEKISGPLKLKRPIRTLRVDSMNSVAGSIAVQRYVNLLNALITAELMIRKQVNIEWNIWVESDFVTRIRYSLWLSLDLLSCSWQDSPFFGFPVTSNCHTRNVIEDPWPSLEGSRTSTKEGTWLISAILVNKMCLIKGLFYVSQPV